MRKKHLLLLLCSLFFLPIFGQGTMETADFQATDQYGNTCYYKITDAANRYVTLWPSEQKIQSGPFTSFTGNTSVFNTSGTEIVIPGSVEYNGNTYYVKRIDQLCYLDGIRFNSCDKLVISEGIEYIPDDGLMWCGGKKSVVLPSTLKWAGRRFLGECFDTEQFIGLENTQLERLLDDSFCQCYNLSTSHTWKLPQTMRYIGENSLPIPWWQREFEIPASVDTINFSFIRDVYSISNRPNATFDNFLKIIRIHRAIPPLVENIRMNTRTNNGFTYYNWNEYGMFTLQEIQYTYTITGVTYHSPDVLYIPVDATAAYDAAGGWEMYKGKYREELTIGPNGYTSYYLENENFLVPAGCTAYIITSVTPVSGSSGTAVVKAFAAGSIIPKQTGFILQGTPGATIAYQANVTGMEVDVTGNLLIGTATEQEFSGAGYRYYLFSKGAGGQGFYYQGTRQGTSIKLGAHKAGLRLSTAGFAPSKSFVFDFEEAKRNLTTGIKSVASESREADNTVYDLQGRRVQNPSKGVYIVNGKKVIIQ